MQPAPFHQVELWTVRWKKRQDQPSGFPLRPLCGDQRTGMDAGPVAHHRCGTVRVRVLSQTFQKRHDVRARRIRFYFSVEDFARSEVHTAQQIQSCTDASLFTGRDSQGVLNWTPTVGVGLGQPHRRFV